MARLARVVVPGLPHHITQRGNRRQQTFFCYEDYAAYVELIAEQCRDEGVAIWSYCLMPNHVHLIAVPHDRARIAAGHRRGPSTLYATDQLPREMARLPVAGAVRVVRHGRTPSPGGRAIRGVESRAGELGGRCGRLALEQCQSAPLGLQRWLGPGRFDAGNAKRLASLSAQRNARRATTGPPQPCPHRSTSRRRTVRRTLRENSRPRPGPKKTRQKAKIL